MWSPEDFPGADSVPWQLLIRARYAHELDAILASVVVNSLGHRLAPERAVALVSSVKSTHDKARASAAQKVGALSLLADWDGELCPKNWPRRWPPRKRGFEELEDPLTTLGVGRAMELLTFASPALQETLGTQLQNLTGVSRQAT